MRREYIGWKTYIKKMERGLKALFKTQTGRGKCWPGHLFTTLVLGLLVSLCALFVKVQTYRTSSTRRQAQLSTLLCFSLFSTRLGLCGTLWAALATAPTVLEHGAERGWNGNRQLMGT